MMMKVVLGYVRWIVRLEGSTDEFKAMTSSLRELSLSSAGNVRNPGYYSSRMK